MSQVVGGEKPSLAYLAHHGVKGMKWGQRKATIKTARQNRGKLGDATAAAEQKFLRTRETGHAGNTAKALAKLNAAHTAEERNRLIAGTMTRGEQAATLILGPLGAVIVGANAVRVRDSRKIKSYPTKILKNVKAEN